MGTTRAGRVSRLRLGRSSKHYIVAYFSCSQALELEKGRGGVTQWWRPNKLQEGA